MTRPTYIPATGTDREVMLRRIGADSIDDLFRDIPSSVALPDLDLAPPLSELDLQRALQQRAEASLDQSRALSFLGGRARRHFSPAVVDQVLLRGEFYTAYTPYQPEVAQGTLQVIFELQSMVSALTALDVTNAGMYDCATALAEGALMACRVTKREHVVALDSVAPSLLAVVRTYLEAQDIPLEVRPEAGDLSRSAALLVQHPTSLGLLDDPAPLAQAAHDAGALLVAVYDPISLGILAPPGDWGADIAVGEGQPLGIATSYGGPYLGLFSCRQDFLRQLPGRIAGETKDTQGRTGYVLTLQAREQHIRRERATSNVCTNTALMGLAATVYLGALGPEGLREQALACYHKAHYAADALAEVGIPRWRPDVPFFNEFVVMVPGSPAAVIDRLWRDHGILAGTDVSDRVPGGLLLAVTELHSRADIDRLASTLSEVLA